MSAYTKGPWEAVEVKEGLWHVLPIHRTPDRLPIAVLDHHRDGHEPTRTIITPADARLIAAAPELLEALKSLVDNCADYEEWQRPCLAFDNAKKAIAKAEGL